MHTINAHMFLLILTSHVFSVPHSFSKTDSSRNYRGLWRRLVRRSTGSKAISFKDETMKIPPQPRKFRLNTQPRCNEIEGNQGYCTEDPDYDETIQQRFEQILEAYPISNLVTDILNETLVTLESPALDTRIGFTSEQTVCHSIENIIYPKRGQTANNEWVFIMQGSVEQGVKVEKCLRAGSQCQLGGVGFPETACRQKYIYKKLLTMDTSGNNMISESVLMPSCCVCYVSSNFVSTRFGQNQCVP